MLVPGVDLAAVLIAHAVGDYVVQSDWMANRKTERSVHGWWAAVVHGATYTLPFLLLTTDWRALAVIAGTHVIIDHWRLARFVVWTRNWLAPVRIRRGHPHEGRVVVESYNPPWRECRSTGFPPNRPMWLVMWLLFIVDNLMHVAINVAALWWVAR